MAELHPQVVGLAPFNRTIVELKYALRIAGMFVAHAFNRTIVELKSRWHGCSVSLSGLLIVP